MGEIPMDPSIAQEVQGPPKDENEARLRQAQAVFKLNARKIQSLEKMLARDPNDKLALRELGPLMRDQAYRQSIIDNKGREETEDPKTQTEIQRQRQ